MPAAVFLGSRSSEDQHVRRSDRHAIASVTIIDGSVVENAAEFPLPHPPDVAFHSHAARERRS